MANIGLDMKKLMPTNSNSERIWNNTKNIRQHATAYLKYKLSKIYIVLHFRDIVRIMKNTVNMAEMLKYLEADGTKANIADITVYKATKQNVLLRVLSLVMVALFLI